MVRNTKTEIYNYIHKQGVTSRMEIAADLSLGRTIVSKYTKELLAEKKIKTVGKIDSDSGRHSDLLSVCGGDDYVISIDLGQKWFRIGMVSRSYTLSAFSKFPSVNLGGAQTGLSIIQKEIEKIVETYPEKQLSGIAVAVSGLVHVQSESIIVANLSGWNNIPLKASLHSTFNVPVLVEESSRLMAIHESMKESGGRYDELVFISVGAGLGAGIISNGKLVKGYNGYAGEFGHIIAEENGIPCACGNNGCLERYASVISMVEAARTAVANGIRTVMSDLSGNNENNVDSFCLAEAYAMQDKVAKNIITNAAINIGKCLSSMVCWLNPHRIVLGGGGMKITDDFFPIVVDACERRCVPGTSVKDIFFQSQKDETSALIGGAVLIYEELLLK